MLIKTEKYFNLNDKDFPIATDFDHLDERALLWISYGVYFGYLPEDIEKFYLVITDRALNPRTSLFHGTGYVHYGNTLSKEEILSYMKKNRFCDVDFENNKNTVESCRKQQDDIVLLLETNIDFSNRVLNLLNSISIIVEKYDA